MRLGGIERMSNQILFSVLLVMLVGLPGGRAAEGTGKSAPPPKPALPPIRSLKMEPASLTLEDGRDERRVLVCGETTTGQRFDLTDEAVLKSDSPDIEIDKSGYIVAQKAGSAEVTVSAGGQKTRLEVTVKDATVPEIRFVRDVQPVLSKLGCNAGTCHGSAKGKNGFKLSLRGYDPEFDYHALIDDVSGRRFNRADPDQSLMLLKPIQAVPHQGGFLFDKHSRFYALIRKWIAEGVNSDPGKA